MDSKLLNPFELFGLNCNSTVKELKKSYYNLALISHPDRGGLDKDMVVLTGAYNYVKKHLENKTDKTYEQLEIEFEDFLKKQQDDKPVNFASIYEETNDWIKDFNKTFETKKKDSPFNFGYGDMMDASVKDYEKKYNEFVNEKPKVKFSRQLIKYEEPSGCHDYIDKFPLSKEKITDFTSKNLNDYYQAFCEPETIDPNINDYDFDVTTRYEQCLKERKLL